MDNLRSDIGELPKEMVGRPIDHRGFPVPWFVTNKTEDGLWDFVHVDPLRIREALKHKKCFVSGERLGKFVAFVIGPMCTINRIASDAPVKPNIGEWSAKVCPFLSRPLAKRPDIAPEGHSTPGILVPGNPGVIAVWVTKEYGMYRNGLFHIGEPERVLWFTRGRRATLEETRVAWEAGADRLQKIAELDGPEAVAEFHRKKGIAREFLL